jgi:ActR/RegA family two-component response regulator
MALQSLLLTADQSMLRQLGSVLHDLGIGVEICHRAVQASECLRRSHFDVAVLDCDASGVEEVITRLRAATSSPNAPLFLIGPANCSSEAAFAGKADHLLARAAGLEETWRALRSARRQMESSMFRYYRVRTDVAALLQYSGGRTVEAHARDVAQSGVGLQAPVALRCGEALGMRLELPACREVIEAQAEVVWSNEKGNAGLRFLVLPAECRSALEAWVGKGLEAREFAFVFAGAGQASLSALSPAGGPASKTDDFSARLARSPGIS